MRPPSAALRAAARSTIIPAAPFLATARATAALSPRHLPTRNLTSTSHRLLPNASSSSAPPAPISKGPIRDESILEKSTHVRLVDPKSGALAGPFHTKTILTKLDRSKFFLQQVAPPQPSRATVSYDPDFPPSNVDVSALVQFPICKLIDKKEEFDKARNAKRKSSSESSTTASAPSGAAGSKEVQLTWSVSPNDLSHKLSKARKEMIKGARINVIVTTKSGGRKYIKGFNAKEDARREELLVEIERFLCSAGDTATTAQETREGEAEKEAAVKEAAPIARRLQEVDWQRGGSAAVMSFECFRK
ncbi:uncharacterized protein UTRI_04891_B [Ustilago trichophora]|uniref:Translation initiation factor 3 N-terminal domain-containing protein n=1 Tax=Ustilago trichophora TaxID=86804 RepID=A0A5C3EGI9_9BASI|nr:uncharacterized protein UTRI_04891_B [Ustilago trichophora]